MAVINASLSSQGTLKNNILQQRPGANRFLTSIAGSG